MTENFIQVSVEEINGFKALISNHSINTKALEEKIIALQQDKLDLRVQIDLNTEEADKAKQTIANLNNSLTNEIKQSNYKINEKLVELIHLKETNANLEFDKKKLIIECDDLKEKIRRFEAKFENQDELKHKIKKYKSKIEKLEEKNNEIKDDLERKNRDLNELHISFEKQSNDFKQYKLNGSKNDSKQICKYKEIITDLNGAIKRQKNFSAIEISKFKKIIADLQINNTNLSSDISYLNGQLITSNSKISELTSKIECLNSDLIEKNEILLESIRPISYQDAEKSKNVSLLKNIKLEKFDDSTEVNQKNEAKIKSLTVENKNLLLKIEKLSVQKEKCDISTQTPTLKSVKLENPAVINEKHLDEIEKLKTELQRQKEIINQIIERSNEFQVQLKETKNENAMIKAKNNKLIENIQSIEISLNEFGSKFIKY
jgi:chromosome segregation ATPase